MKNNPEYIDKTITYYNDRFSQFTETTVNVEFSEIQDWFLQQLPPGSLILDFGCGSGRDSKYFLNKGYFVDAIDGSEEMVRIASANTGLPVKHMYFQELDETDKYDGIFACASILHVTFGELPDIFERMKKALKPDGILYVSFKYGTFEGYRNDRYFTDMDEDKFSVLLKQVFGLIVIDEMVTGDARPGRSEEKWLNALLRKTGE